MAWRREVTMPVYKTKWKDRWRVRLWRKGERKDWIVHGSKADAKLVEAEKRIELEMDDEVVESPAIPTFFEFCAVRYRIHAENNLAPSTWSGRQYQVARLMHHLGRWPLDQISPQRIEDFKTARLKAGCIASTVNNDLKVLSAILNFAAELEIPFKVPRIRKMKERGKARVQYWTPEEVGRLLSAVEEVVPEILGICVFLAHTGCRKGEAISLKARSVDLERGLVRIEPNEEWVPKGNRPREVPVGAALAPWLVPERLGKVWAFPCYKSGEKWHRFPDRLFAKARDAAGLVGGIHRLRHSYATQVLLETRDLFLVSKLLGHTHSRTTEIYAHLLTDHLDRARDAVQYSWGGRDAGPEVLRFAALTKDDGDDVRTLTSGVAGRVETEKEGKTVRATVPEKRKGVRQSA